MRVWLPGPGDVTRNLGLGRVEGVLEPSRYPLPPPSLPLQQSSIPSALHRRRKHRGRGNYVRVCFHFFKSVLITIMVSFRDHEANEVAMLKSAREGESSCSLTGSLPGFPN